MGDLQESSQSIPNLEVGNNLASSVPTEALVPATAEAEIAKKAENLIPIDAIKVVDAAPVPESAPAPAPAATSESTARPTTAEQSDPNSIASRIDGEQAGALGDMLKGLQEKEAINSQNQALIQTGVQNGLTPEDAQLLPQVIDDLKSSKGFSEEKFNAYPPAVQKFLRENTPSDQLARFPFLKKQEEPAQAQKVQATTSELVGATTAAGASEQLPATAPATIEVTDPIASPKLYESVDMNRSGDLIFQADQSALTSDASTNRKDLLEAAAQDSTLTEEQRQAAKNELERVSYQPIDSERSPNNQTTVDTANYRNNYPPLTRWAEVFKPKDDEAKESNPAMNQSHLEITQPAEENTDELSQDDTGSTQENNNVDSNNEDDHYLDIDPASGFDPNSPVAAERQMARANMDKAGLKYRIEPAPGALENPAGPTPEVQFNTNRPPDAKPDESYEDYTARKQAEEDYFQSHKPFDALEGETKVQYEARKADEASHKISGEDEERERYKQELLEQFNKGLLTDPEKIKELQQLRAEKSPAEKKKALQDERKTLMSEASKRRLDDTEIQRLAQLNGELGPVEKTKEERQAEVDAAYQEFMDIIAQDGEPSVDDIERLKQIEEENDLSSATPTAKEALDAVRKFQERRKNSQSEVEAYKKVREKLTLMMGIEMQAVRAPEQIKEYEKDCQRLRKEIRLEEASFGTPSKNEDQFAGRMKLYNKKLQLNEAMNRIVSAYNMVKLLDAQYVEANDYVDTKLKLKQGFWGKVMTKGHAAILRAKASLQTSMYASTVYGGSF